MHRSSLRVLIVFIFIFTGLFGQNLSIQGVARDNTGQSLPDGTAYEFTFRLYTVESSGSNVWVENQTLSVLNGVFSTILGAETSMEGLDFNNQYWLSLEIDGNGELSPRTKLILSPYTIMAGLSGVDNVVPQSGFAGIGTTNPASILHVKNGAANTRVTIERDSDGEEAFVQYRTDGSNKALIGLDNDSQDLRFYSYDEGVGTMGTFQMSTGNFGLGTGSPAAKLHVNGLSLFEVLSGETDVATLPGLTIANAGRSGGNQIAGNRTKLSFKQYMAWNDYVEAGAIVTGNNTNNYNFGYMSFFTMNEHGGGLNERMRIDWNGDIGIGTTSPEAKLDVVGSLDIDSWKSQDLSENGYVQMGGLIFQWGVFECSIDGAQYEAFPTDFPTACFGVYSNRKETGPESPITVSWWTQDGFYVDRENGISNSQTVNWFAVGH